MGRHKNSPSPNPRSLEEKIDNGRKSLRNLSEKLEQISKEKNQNMEQLFKELRELRERVSKLESS